MKITYEIRDGDFSHAGFASSEIKKRLKQLNLPVGVIKRAAISMYEAEINMVIHANGGTAEVEIHPDQVKITMTDTGPGIADLDLAMKEGWSTASNEARELGFGAGLGLPNMKKNSDEFHLESEVGVGTKVSIIMHLGE